MIITNKRLSTFQKLVNEEAEEDEIKRTKRFVSIPLGANDTKLHSKADRGGDEESTSRSMTRRQQRYANEGDLVLIF